jgi:hypothetical protein
LLTFGRMEGIKRFLIVVWLAGCGGGGGGDHGDAGNSGDAQPGDGGSGSDASAVQASGNDHCAGAFPINLATAHIDVAADPSGASADLAAPCGTAGTPDVFFKFTLTRRELVYADTFGSSSSTALFFASSCTTARTVATTPGDAVCSTGACDTAQSQVVALLDPGTHYLVLAATGAATIHFQHAQVGSGNVAYLAQGSSAPTGTTVAGAGTLYACDAGGTEDAYWWRSCPLDPGGAFSASTCAGTDFDTILSLQMPGSEAVMCDDDTCLMQSTVSASLPGGAGLYVVAVDGFSQSRYGNYTLTVARP